jgi:hypothetical protein
MADTLATNPLANRQEEAEGIVRARIEDAAARRTD